MLRADDELRREAFITNRAWSILAKRYNAKQLIEIVFTVGGYSMTRPDGDFKAPLMIDGAPRSHGLVSLAADGVSDRHRR